MYKEQQIVTNKQLWKELKEEYFYLLTNFRTVESNEY